MCPSTWSVVIKVVTGASEYFMNKESHSTHRSTTTLGFVFCWFGYLPIYALSGPSGKLFHPMADTMSFALFGTLVWIVVASAAGFFVNPVLYDVVARRDDVLQV